MKCIYWKKSVDKGFRIICTIVLTTLLLTCTTYGVGVFDTGDNTAFSISSSHSYPGVWENIAYINFSWDKGGPFSADRATTSVNRVWSNHQVSTYISLTNVDNINTTKSMPYTTSGEISLDGVLWTGTSSCYASFTDSVSYGSVSFTSN